MNENFCFNFNLKDFPLIEKWINENERASKLVSFINIQNDIEKMLNYPSKKIKTINQLKNQEKQLETYKNDVIHSLEEITQQPFMKLGNLIFDEQNQNFELRKLVFLHREIQNTNLKLTNESLNMYTEQIENFQKLIELLESDLIPDFIMCKIDGKCFMTTITKSMEQLAYQKAALQTCYDNLEKKTREFKQPKWVNDFSGYLHDILPKCVEHLDEQLSYVPPLPVELSLSRYCFSGLNQTSELIDSTINLYFENDLQVFLKKVLDFSLSLIPNLDTFTPNEQSVGLLLFFRIVFDRFYELYPDILILPEKKEDLRKMEEFSKLPCKYFNLPNDSAPQFSPDEEIKIVFHRDKYYLSSILFLESSMYYTNPIDCLYIIHKTLLSINKAALMQRFKEKPASFDDIQQLLCFDDLFILFFGVYVSSDMFEFESLCTFVSNFAPTFCLSNAFEYAQASLESLVRHIKTITSDSLIQSFETKQE